MRVVISSASTGSSADAGPLAELREFGSVGTRSAGPSAYAVTEMQAKPNRTAEASLMPSHLEKENASTVAVGPCGRDARIGRVVYFWILQRYTTKRRNRPTFASMRCTTRCTGRTYCGSPTNAAKPTVERRGGER